MKKVMRVGTVDCNSNGCQSSLFVVFEYPRYPRHGCSFTGVMGPRANGDADGGCGQIDMEFAHRNPDHDDARFVGHLKQPGDISFAPGWDAEKWLTYLEYWKLYHMKEPQPIVVEWICSLPDADRQPAWC